MALEFVIHTAARSGEVLGARWDEFDLDAKVWTISASRMKAGKIHRVPLSYRSLEIIAELAKVQSGEIIFPGQRHGRSLSHGAMRMILHEMGVDGATAHGFRSSFRDWAGDTGVARELAEASLAHAIGSAVEQSYRRGDDLERCRAVMQCWSDFCGRGIGSDNVVLLTRK